jgi:hypothetical protein
LTTTEETVAREKKADPSTPLRFAQDDTFKI